MAAEIYSSVCGCVRESECDCPSTRNETFDAGEITVEKVSSFCSGGCATYRVSVYA